MHLLTGFISFGCTYSMHIDTSGCGVVVVNVDHVIVVWGVLARTIERIESTQATTGGWEVEYKRRGTRWKGRGRGYGMIQYITLHGVKVESMRLRRSLHSIHLLLPAMDAIQKDHDIF